MEFAVARGRRGVTVGSFQRIPITPRRFHSLLHVLPSLAPFSTLTRGFGVQGTGLQMITRMHDLGALEVAAPAWQVPAPVFSMFVSKE